MDGTKRVLSPTHPANRLLKNPSSNKGGADFFVEVIASKLLYGNSYILATGEGYGVPKKLFVLPSNNIEIIVEKSKPIAYRYNSGGKKITYPINPISRISRVLHLKNYHPTDPIYGMACLDAASISIEIHTRASNWNSSLLQNAARPSGALIMRDPNGYLSDEQFERLQQQFYEKYTGSSNIGRPLLLEGGLDWKEMSISPKDMDFIESKNSAAREIALAFGVPPQLLGISGDNTYSNMQEARLALWEETLIPLLDKIADGFSNWFSYLFNEDILVDFDRDSISALTEKRENLWGKISASNFMTINEKRAFVGLPPIKGEDILHKIEGKKVTKNNITQLYSFITKIILLLEDDLDNIASEDKELKLKRNITSILNRLVTILILLNKLSKEEQGFLSDELPDEDIKIIERFLEKYRK